jgi:hypothetical protein
LQQLKIKLIIACPPCNGPDFHLLIMSLQDVAPHGFTFVDKVSTFVKKHFFPLIFFLVAPLPFPSSITQTLSYIGVLII